MTDTEAEDSEDTELSELFVTETDWLDLVTDTEDEDSEDTENIVLETIKGIEGEDGAAWDLIVENCKKKGLDENTIEEALTSLMDKGFIFEPVLGTIKTT